MQFDPPLVPAVLVRRYKRFLADVVLEGGEAITCSVPNTGSMMGLQTPGSRVWLSVSDDRARKYAHRLELVEADGTLVGINTGLPNRLVEEALCKGLIASLAPYPTLQRERAYGINSRIDMLLSGDGLPDAYVEVKNVHLVRTPGLAEFPDSVTARGVKHLQELSAMVAAGHRAIMVYLIQRADCAAFALCRDLDPAYATAFDKAMGAGVEAVALRCTVTSDAIAADTVIPVREPLAGMRNQEQA